MRKLLFLGALLAVHASAAAQPLEPRDVPAPLRPWVDWALRGFEELRCPGVLRGDQAPPECSWPTRLELEVNARDARFRLQARRYARGFLPLPGAARLWPQEVRVDGRPAPVVEHGGGPAVEIPPGEVAVTGRFDWDAPPASLPLSAGTALIQLSVNGARVRAPEIDDGGQLLLRRQSTAAAEERLEIHVQRKLTDGVPLRVDTRLVLDVAGKAREVLLGRVLPEGFEPLALDGPLPARLESDGRLRVQVRPGSWVLTVSGRRAALTTAVTRPVANGPWVDGDEVWVFQANPSLRLVTVEGLPAVEPSQTQLPPDWKSFPAYAVRAGETMRLEVRRRGDADPEPDRLTLKRDLWLDFSGDGWTVSDRLEGALSRSWRLEMAQPLQLGRVAVAGRDQPITRLSPQAPPGVEVRQGALALVADARLDGAARTLPAVGWDEDVTALAATLHLPPGWQLFAASGVDEVPGTWLRRWSLLDLFLVLVLALSAARLHAVSVGALALVTLVLTFPEADAPRWTWVAVLGLEALVRVLPEGRLSRVLRGARLVAFAFLALMLVQFAVVHVRAALYPALDGPVAAGARLDDVVRVIASPRSPAEADRSVLAEEEGDEGAVEGKAAGGAQNIAEMPAPRADNVKTPTPTLGISKSTGKAYGTLAGRVSTSPALELDRLAMVQTGPGVPGWSWSELPLRWNGPVQRGQTLHLYLVSPGGGRVLAFLRVLLLTLLALRLFGGLLRFLPRFGRPAAAALLLGALTLPSAARAEEQPSDARLEELRNRLLAPPRCAPSCVEVSRLLLEVEQDRIRLRLEVAAAAEGTWALPGGPQWLPGQVIIDGRPATALRREQGHLLAAVGPGVHQVLLEGALPAGDSLQLPVGKVPGYTQVRASGWKVDGVDEDGRAGETLQLTRLARKPAGTPGGELRPEAIPPFVRVVRHLRLGLTWEVETSVIRLSAPGSGAVLEVPLLPGESVTSADARVSGGRVQVNLAPTAERVAWRATLEPREALTLTAPASGAWVEEWTLEAGTMWHVVLGGIPPLHPAQPAGVHLPTWEPWPGEQVTLKLTRPAGAGGNTLTIDSTQLSVTPGLRATDATLDVVLRSSRGTQQSLVLPPGAELLGVVIAGQSQPIRAEGGRVVLPISPGKTAVKLRWREPRGLEMLFRPGVIDIGAPVVNASTELRLPRDRWILLAGGPLLGPAVLFWSQLVVTLLVAVALGRVTLVPLRTASWVLLGLGLTQVPVWAGALVVVCLLAFGWRARHGPAIASARVFDLLQVLLAVLAVVAGMVLFAAIRQGLLGAPEMQVQGNGSSAAVLRWFQDRTPGPLPQPWVLSVPLLVYRLAMLAWALWLATALLRWFRWGAAAAVTGGLWRRTVQTPPKAEPVAPTVPPTAG